MSSKFYSVYSHTPTRTLTKESLALFYKGQHYLFSHQNEIREKRLAFPSGHGFFKGKAQSQL